MRKRGAREIPVFVALLRGVNVGGNRIVSMSALKQSFETIGLEDVSTYINSGNVLFRSKETDARKLERRVERMLVNEYKVESRVLIRSFSEIAKLIAHWPADWNDHARGWKYNVIFLSRAIDSRRILKRLNPKPDIENVIYLPGTLLWSARGDALGRTSMLKLGRQATYQEVTVRSSNTVRKLYELMKEMRHGLA
jgi:uncharacterized protein (DUF1697 family)